MVSNANSSINNISVRVEKTAARKFKRNNRASTLNADIEEVPIQKRFEDMTVIE